MYESMKYRNIGPFRGGRSTTVTGIPEDIFLVLAIDAILISLRLSNKLKTGQFIGAKVVGTGLLIGSHWLGIPGA